MKKIFKNKVNVFLFFFLIVVGFSSIILKVKAKDNHLIQTNIQEGNTDLLFEVKKLVDLSKLNESHLISGLPTYAVRSSEDKPLGYIDSTFVRCFIEMKPVSFEPRYKYKEVSSDALYGFSVPLVGDLNGDGRPEIVALGSNGQLNGYASYFYVFNGQTGEVIVKYRLPNNIYPVISGYHGSPSQLALVDSDRDGKAEIIVCFSRYPESTTYSKKIISYEINENTFNSSISTTNSSKLTQKWISDIRYDAYGPTNSSTASGYNYDYPLPQIVDIDADGTPELIVYNKIYSALTGKYIMKFGELGNSVTNKTVNIGSSGNEGPYYEEYIAFPMIYDIDRDGKYDFIAGGKIYYDIDLSSGTYKTLHHAAVKDGRTAVADINGDGIPDIVVSNYLSKGTTVGQLNMTVWNPDFETQTGEIIATHIFNTYNLPAQGNHSYLFIGDIDGKEQNGKKYPEISLLTACPYLTSGTEMKGIPVHPNVTDGGITTNKTLSKASVQGVILSFTWDNTEGLTTSERLKVSFMLEHSDRSVNTGFTLFDFDNDGIQDICYRDESTLRIISARKSYVILDETELTAPDVIRFKKNVLSFTGYEYPVIADIDGDASADMIVMGRSKGVTDDVTGYIFAVEGKNGDLAPAPKVWNQFMYSPLKINEDLTTPRKTYHPLDPAFAYYKSAEDTEPTFIYNNTITQVPFFSSFEEDGKQIMKPIVRLPDAKVLDLHINMSGKTLSFKLANIGDATLNSAIPIRIYQDETLLKEQEVGFGGLFVGDTVSYSVPITNTLATYKILVGGRLDNNMLFIPDDNVDDCNWADNMDEIATFLPKNDAVTVVQYGSVMIDVLANDILQDECSVQILTPEVITSPSGKGIMSGAFGTLQIINNKILFIAPESYPGGVVEFSYTLTCSGVEKTAKVYAYVLESCSFGFAACAGYPYQVCVNENPEGVKFEWFDSSDEYIGETAPNIPNVITDMVYYVRPKFNELASSPYRTISFAKSKLIVKALNSTDKLNARWTGEVDNNWNNPSNWVQVLTNGNEAPVTWAPIGCVNVVVSNKANRFPELTLPVECGKIHIEDRAMVSGIHNLVYTEATVDFTPKAAEKNRFVMWSAPLKDMYTGDYHFTTSGNTPDWGHIYMNFFQSANPDYSGSVEKEKTFTATFGSTETSLPLGKAFNVRVLGGKENGFNFPRSAVSYVNANGENSGSLSRTNSKRFITDGAIDSNGNLDLPVQGDNGYSLIQVVNPFMAYLKLGNFLSANSSEIENSYYAWNGDVNADFITILNYKEDNEFRYVIDDAGLRSGTEDYIAPLQSFFVKKRNPSSSVTSLRMNALTMTTTSLPGENETYVLRSSGRGVDEASLLRITATCGEGENSTVLLKTLTESLISDRGGVTKSFNSGVPISVYTLTDRNEALAIRTSNRYSEDVKLGLRLKNTTNQITLSFSEIASFGQNVRLIDHEMGGREIDLQKENSYAFTVKSESTKEIVELNNRFSLKFGENPVNIENIVTESNLKVSGKSNCIEISSVSPFNRVEIVSLTGMKVYDSVVPATYSRAAVAPNQVYIVRVTVGNHSHVQKVYVR